MALVVLNGWWHLGYGLPIGVIFCYAFLHGCGHALRVIAVVIHVFGEYEKLGNR